MRVNEWRLIVVGIGMITCAWIVLGAWVWKNIPTPEQEASERVYDIQKALKVQKYMVDMAIIHEMNLKTRTHDEVYRLHKLEKYRRMLQPMDQDED